MFEKTSGAPKDLSTLVALVGAFALYVSVRSAERLEEVSERIHKESKRMTILTISIVVLTVVVAYLSAIQVWSILTG